MKWLAWTKRNFNFTITFLLGLLPEDCITTLSVNIKYNAGAAATATTIISYHSYLLLQLYPGALSPPRGVWSIDKPL